MFFSAYFFSFVSGVFLALYFSALRCGWDCRASCSLSRRLRSIFFIFRFSFTWADISAMLGFFLLGKSIFLALFFLCFYSDTHGQYWSLEFFLFFIFRKKGNLSFRSEFLITTRWTKNSSSGNKKKKKRNSYAYFLTTGGILLDQITDYLFRVSWG